MEKDKFECYGWAKGQTGFDPMEVPTATAPPPDKKAGGSTAAGVARGGLGGAALGAAVGAIAGDAGKGAAIGAASGGLLGGARGRRSQTEQKNWEQEQVANYQRNRDAYNRAYRACLEGRGYSVQ